MPLPPPTAPHELCRLLSDTDPRALSILALVRELRDLSSRLRHEAGAYECRALHDLANDLRRDLEPASRPTWQVLAVIDGAEVFGR